MGWTAPRTRQMRWGVLLVALAFVGMASANTAPLADAGLDQQATRGATVYLDAGGSTDPDGTITDYEWSITGPNGTAVDPDCRTCEQTQFVPNGTGEYAATVAVTDDDGATREDTLYVTVEEAEPPSVTVSGPDAIVSGDERTYQAEATAGDATLSTVTWRVDGIHHVHTRTSGDSATVSEGFTLPAGDHIVSVTVIDDDGRRDTDEQTVQVVDRSDVDGDGTAEVDGKTVEATGGGGDGIIQYDAEAGEWSVDTDLAARMTGNVEVGDATVTTRELENIESSRGVVETFEREGTNEDQMVKAAAQQKNNFQATGEGNLDTIDNSVGQVDYEGDLPGGSAGSTSDRSPSVGGYGGADSYSSGGGSSYSSGGSSYSGGTAGGHSTGSRSSIASGGTSVGL
jgi:hypothetical protein